MAARPIAVSEEARARALHDALRHPRGVTINPTAGQQRALGLASPRLPTLGSNSREAPTALIDTVAAAATTSALRDILNS